MALLVHTRTPGIQGCDIQVHRTTAAGVSTVVATGFRKVLGATVTKVDLAEAVGVTLPASGGSVTVLTSTPGEFILTVYGL